MESVSFSAFFGNLRIKVNTSFSGVDTRALEARISGCDAVLRTNVGYAAGFFQLVV
jgi:hypothetical protein